MSKIKFLSVFIFFIAISTFAQKSLNEYKYVIVPEQFQFQKEANSYDLNALSKFLFNKYGFTAFLSTDTYPEDLRMNPCLALTANLEKKSGMLSTSVYFELKDCGNKIIFTSEIAKSKEKDFKAAYNLSLIHI